MSAKLIQKLMKAKAENKGLQINTGEVEGMLRLITDDEFSQRKNIVLKAASAGLADAWSAAFFDYNTEYELWIIICVFGWLTVHYFAVRYSRKRGGPLVSRPTFIANNIHCITTSLCAAFLLAQDKSVRDYNLWQRWVLPFSISYFIADGIWYCIPKRDLLISLHHVVMIMCHYPVGEPAAALLCGAGQWKWAAWVSMTGYLAELSNPLLNVRWWLMQTLEKDHWLFGANNTLIVLSFVGRIVLFPYLIVYDIWPRRQEFVEKKRHQLQQFRGLSPESGEVGLGVRGGTL